MLELNFTPFTELRSERLYLRRPDARDIPSLFTLRGDARIMEHVARPRFSSLQEAEELMATFQELINNNTGISWAITLKENPDEMIGHIGYWRIDKENHRAEIGYLLHIEHWHQGIMTEAIKCVLDFGFENLHFHAVEGHTGSENIASQATLKKAGFRQEAYFREDTFFEGQFLDTVVFCKLASDHIK